MSNLSFSGECPYCNHIFTVRADSDDIEQETAKQICPDCNKMCLIKADSVESIFRRSEFWSFAIAQISYLMKPTQFIEFAWDSKISLHRYIDQNCICMAGVKNPICSLL